MPLKCYKTQNRKIITNKWITQFLLTNDAWENWRYIAKIHDASSEEQLAVFADYVLQSKFRQNHDICIPLNERWHYVKRLNCFPGASIARFITSKFLQCINVQFCFVKEDV